MRKISAAFMTVPSEDEKIDFIRSELRAAHCPLFYEGGNKKREAESLSGYYLLLCLLRSAGKTDFIEFIKKDHFGRPSFRNYPWLDFNISHTSGIAVCALGDGRRVGIDIERIPVGVDRNRVAERFFSDREKKEYALGGGTEEAFATVWTRMEAYCKYTGLGMEETEPTGKELSALTFLTRMIIIGNREYVLSLCSKKLAGEGEDGVISQFFERIYVMPK